MANDGICLVCKNPMPDGAALCTECESWQLRHRHVTLAAKLLLALLVPVLAWVITDHYQRKESIRTAMDAYITRATDQIGSVVDLSKDFQTADDSFTASCGKDAQGAANLCLSEYMARIVHLNELVAQLSWKAGLLSVSAETDAVQREWQKEWWDEVSVKLKRSLGAMAVDGRLVKCQALEFSSSACGGELNTILQPFRAKTMLLMCTLTQAHRKHLAALYELLPDGAEKTQLVQGVTWQITSSFCATLVGRPHE